jgi:hypothetical protein
MEPTPDELAGVIDIVGPLTRAELGRACSELAFKRGDRVEADSFESDIDTALTAYCLVAVADHATGADDPLLVVGPAAFPAVTDGVEDLPHILDVPERELSKDAVATAAETRFRADAAAAVEAGDADRIGTLLDVSYDLEAWGPVALDSARDRLDEATQTN